MPGRAVPVTGAGAGTSPAFSGGATHKLDILILKAKWILLIEMSLTGEKKKRKKKGKYRKNSQYEHQLKKEDLEFLTLKTKYTSDEIIEWHRSSLVD